MNKNVRIFQPSKTAMQSGKGKTKIWIMEYITDDSLTPDPLMGWATMNDTTAQIHLKFESQDEAIAYAKAKCLNFVIEEPHQPRVPPKAYAENFAFGRRNSS